MTTNNTANNNNNNANNNTANDKRNAAILTALTNAKAIDKLTAAAPIVVASLDLPAIALPCNALPDVSLPSGYTVTFNGNGNGRAINVAARLDIMGKARAAIADLLIDYPGDDAPTFRLALIKRDGELAVAIKAGRDALTCACASLFASYDTATVKIDPVIAAVVRHARAPKESLAKRGVALQARVCGVHADLTDYRKAADGKTRNAIAKRSSERSKARDSDAK